MWKTKITKICIFENFLTKQYLNICKVFQTLDCKNQKYVKFLKIAAFLQKILFFKEQSFFFSIFHVFIHNMCNNSTKLDL